MRIALSMVVLAFSCAFADAGEFKGTLELIPPGCEKQLDCTLKSEFGYIDSNGMGWQAMAGLKTDGASIPPWAQLFIGGQFDKEYIRAAVIHDHYCKRNVRDWRTTHWAFYDALLSDRVSDAKALLMYYAVYLGGPKWIELIKGKPCTTGQNCMQKVADMTLPTNTTQAKSDETGGTYMVRQHQYDAPGFVAELKEVEKLLSGQPGTIKKEDLEKRAQGLRPNDFFYAHSAAAISVPASPDK